MEASPDFLKHDKSDEMWISDNRRRCARCEREKDLWAFRPKHAPRNKSMVSPYCIKCLGEMNPSPSEIARMEALKLSAEAKMELAQETRELNTLLAMPSRQKRIRAACPDPTEALHVFMERRGGIEPFMEKISDAVNESMEDGSPDTKIRAAQTSIKFLLDVKKLENDKPDLSDIDQEELFPVLKEAAMDLLRTNKLFLTELLNEPDIRSAVLDHLGIEVIEQS